tara:strand:+ start:135 stop:464 length:330 start_codon:yes stop_codon:yes gene_type:complete
MAYYKPLEFRDSIMNANEQRVMVARLNECKESQFGPMTTHSHNSNCTHTITVDWDSPIAVAIRNKLNDRENPYIKINLDNERVWVILDDVYEGNPTKIYHYRLAEYFKN